MSPVPAPARMPARAPLPYRSGGATASPGAARPSAARAAAARPATTRPTTAPPAVVRPRLRLVDNARLEVAVRRRRARRLLVVAAVMAVGALLALAGVNALLVSNQVRLDALEQQVVEAQARHQALRLEVATLEAPERVVSAATDRLGMVAPETITYVQPAPTPAAARGEASPLTDVSAGQAGASTAATPAWGAVKPYLSR